MGDIKVSFIIPCYNAQTYIQRCVTSIHPTVPYEIIVVNDGSLDDTRQVIERLRQNHQEMRLLNKENEGVNAARRDGWRMAKGEYVCFVDADDTICQNLEIWAWLEKGYDIIKAGGYYVNGSTRILYRNHYIGEIRNMEHAYNLMLEGKLLPFIHSSIYRKKAIDDDCFDISSRFKIGEDLLFNLKLMGKVKRMVSIESAFYNYMMNVDSVMHNKVWGFSYIQAFNDELGRLILQQVPDLERKVIIHRFLDYVGTMLFPEVDYRHEYYQEINSLLSEYPWVKSYAPKKSVLFIGQETLYKMYLSLFHFIQKCRGKGRRVIID